MRLMQTGLASLLATTAAVAADGDVSSGDYLLQLRAGLWLGQVTSGAFDPAGVTSAVDLDTAGFDDAELGFYAEVGVRPPLIPFVPDVHVGYLSWAVENDSGDELTNGDLYVEATWGLAIGELAGVGLGVAIHAFDVEIESADTSAYDESAVVPALAGRFFAHPINSLDVQGRLHWSDGFDDSLLDLEAFVTYYPHAAIGIQAGLRYLALEMDDDDEGFDNAIFGPFLGAALQY